MLERNKTSDGDGAESTFPLIIRASVYVFVYEEGWSRMVRNSLIWAGLQQGRRHIIRWSHVEGREVYVKLILLSV